MSNNTPRAWAAAAAGLGQAAGAVRHHVARAQQLEDLRQRRRRGPDVRHHRYAARLRRGERAAQRFDPVRADRLGVDPHLDATDQVAVLADHPGGQIGVARLQGAALPGAGGQALPGDVHPGHHPDLPAGRGSAQGGQRVRTRRAGVHPGGDAGVPGDRIRVDAPVAGLRVYVRVQVDQARGDQPAGDVDDRTGRAGQLRAHRGDPAVPYRHVQPARPPAAGVEHLAADEQQVVRLGHAAGLRNCRR
jgi:hypothetical protein